MLLLCTLLSTIYVKMILIFFPQQIYSEGRGKNLALSVAGNSPFAAKFEKFNEDTGKFEVVKNGNANNYIEASFFVIVPNVFTCP